MSAPVNPEVLAAFRQQERELTIRKTRIGCIIGIVLVPLFTLLDRQMYPGDVRTFLYLRLACSLSMLLLYPLTGTKLGRRFFRVQGLVLLALPTLCISWMIYVKEGAASPYYAGLTLVLMVLAVVLDWTFWQSAAAVLIVVVSYFTVCLLHGPVVEPGLFYNNIAFLFAPGIVIMTGTYFHSRLRLSEFASNYQLDQSRQALAAQNTVLENTLQQLKETELQLVQTEKIVSLGRLSAGIIHEINNPLNFAATGLYVLRQQGQRLATDEPAEFAEVVRDIEDGVQRVKNIVSDLRSFTHPDADQRDQVPFAEVITASLRLLSNEWKDKVVIEQTVAADMFCHANKNKLTQVFVNLIQNSLDALKSKPAQPEPPLISITGRHEPGRVIVSVRDNGEGIEAQNVGKIFDPFFTTRDIGQGMGMGLSICYRIIQELSGTISVRSERGKFCEFTIDLPDAKVESIAA